MDEQPLPPDAPEPEPAPAREELRIKDLSSRSRACNVCRKEKEPYIQFEVDGVLEFTCRTCYEGEVVELTACRSCGAALEVQDRFCGKCGTPRRDRCPSCGATATDPDRFCGKCGANLSAAPL